MMSVSQTMLRVRSGDVLVTFDAMEAGPRRGMFGSKVKAENAQLEQRVRDLQMRLGQLEQVMAECGAGDVLRTKDVHQSAIVAHEQYVAWADSQRQQFDRERALLEQEHALLKNREVNLRQELDELSAQIVGARESIDLQEDGLFDFPNPAEESVRLQGSLAEVRAGIKDMVRAKQAVVSTTNFTFNNSAAKGRKFVTDMSRMMLRAYNAEAENAVLTVRAGNLDAAIKRLERARDQASKLGSMISLSVTPTYHALRVQELVLAAQHLQAKVAAKEAEREERARLREEKKAQEEMEAERRRLEKEKNHYENTIAVLREQGRVDEAEALLDKLAEVQRGIDDVDYRQANIRAGYVYVISNVGSFGERMVKIGMTRRLNPIDRVRELSDASVPFNFDVHALFFSDDAVGVETALHHRFAPQRVNMVNARREFFYATPAEVKEALTSVAGQLLEFVDEPEAEQFRQSSSIRDQLSPARV